MAITCIGCSLGHLTNARTLLAEARKFYSTGQVDLADKHLVKALGELRQAEEQHPYAEDREQIRGIRKRIEAAIATKSPLPDVDAELEHKSIKALHTLSEHPELCPTCQIAVGEAHD